MRAASKGTEMGMQKVFIVGQYKSGTTWLLRCLGSHPSAAAIRELDLIRAVVGDEAKTLTALPHDEVLKNIFGRSAFLNLPRDFIEKNGNIYRRSAKEMLSVLRKCHNIEFKQEKLPIQIFANCLKASRFRHLSICYRIAFKEKDIGNTDPVISFSEIEDRFLLDAIGSLLASNSAVEMMDRFIGSIQPMFKGKNVLVLKGADQIVRFNLLEQWVPAAKKIAIVRDGRDACISAHHFRLLMKEKNAAFTPQSAPVDFRSLLLGWKSRAQILMGLRSNSNLKIIRYEDLILDFETTMADLFFFLEIPAGKDLITEIRLRNTFRVVAGRRPGKPAKHILRSGVCGEWMNALSKQQKEEAWEIAGNQLEAFGYRRNGI